MTEGKIKLSILVTQLEVGTFCHSREGGNDGTSITKEQIHVTKMDSYFVCFGKC
ncbi:MAG: hypothetical protein ABII25_09815 [bacterium]